MTQNPEKQHKLTPKLQSLQDHSVYSSNLNNSSSKMLYSIPKSPRWKDQNQHSQDNHKFYDLPKIGSNRSTSFGYGSKMDLSKNGRISPPPNTYSIASQFQGNKKKGIAIGLGRELVKAVSAFDQKPFKIPGPGTYDVKYQQSHQQCSLSGRTQDLSDKWTKQVPGPGTYKTLDLLDKNMHSNVSKFQSVKSARFSKGEPRKQFQKNVIKQHIPDPTKYGLQHYDIIDRFPRNKGRTFGHSQRPSIADKTTVPGPGAYSFLSQFIH